MKKLIISLIFICLFTTGCTLFKSDSLENATIITSNYSVEYITNYLYGDKSLVTEIYPDGTNIDKYKLTEKQIKDFSKKDLFIYMGKTNDNKTTVTFLNKNKNLKIIDASYELPYINKVDELWLNPSNLLAMAQNVKLGFNEYISSTYALKDIDNNYNNLKIDISTLDAEYKTTISNGKSDTIVVNDDSLLYLKKYDLNVISVDKNNPDYEKNLTLFKSNIKNNTIKYLYVYENTKNTKDVNTLLEESNIETITFRNLKNITEEDREKNNDYLSIMYDNLDKLKKELYKSTI